MTFEDDAVAACDGDGESHPGPTANRRRLDEKALFCFASMADPTRNRIGGSTVVLAAVVLSGCMNEKAGSNSTAGSASAPAVQSRWSDAGGGLELGLDAPAGPLVPGSEVELTLLFRNASTEPLRIYLLPEPFRANISTLFVRGAPASTSFPPPRGHGHLPDEDDFPLIAAGASFDAKQRFTVPGGVDRFEVHWKYVNRITSVPGGVQTLDGVSKPLFGGGPIPHIWTGEATRVARFTVAK